MPKGQVKEWRHAITDRLVLDFSMVTVPGLEAEYSLNLSGLVDGEWEPLVRYDNSHDSVPHRHTYYPDGTSSEHPFIAAIPQTFFAQAQKELSARAEEYLDEYDRKLANLKRGR